MADALCSEDPSGPTLPKTRTWTAGKCPTGLMSPAVAPPVAALLAQALIVITTAATAAKATTHAGVRDPVRLVLITDAAAEHIREQETREASPQTPLRFKDETTLADVGTADVHVRDQESREASPQAPLRFQDKTNLADELPRNCIA